MKLSESNQLSHFTRFGRLNRQTSFFSVCCAEASRVGQTASKKSGVPGKALNKAITRRVQPSRVGQTASKKSGVPGKALNKAITRREQKARVQAHHPSSSLLQWEDAANSGGPALTAGAVGTCPFGTVLDSGDIFSGKSFGPPYNLGPHPTKRSHAEESAFEDQFDASSSTCVTEPP